MTFIGPVPEPEPLRRAIQARAYANEASCVEELLEQVRIDPALLETIEGDATRFIEAIRRRSAAAGGLDAFLGVYDLSSREGVLLMCLAEALLRIPDAATADRLIAEKIGTAAWESRVGRSESLFVNASTWALMLTGRVIRFGDHGNAEPRSLLKRMVARSGEPLIRQAVLQAMRIMGRQFVLGRTIGEALERAREAEARGYLFSYDMLGEAACDAGDAQRHFQSYADAIGKVGGASNGRGPWQGPGVSIKLSALHPRFVHAQRERIFAELVPRIVELARLARSVDIGLTIDSEEADRLELTLDVFERVLADPDLAGWEGLGLAVQAYQKRARPQIAWLAALARTHGQRLPVRLVKGAYWDAEIKRAQELGLADYPVFTRKVNTDLSYLTCAQALFAAPDAFRPAFATHNAHTLAAVRALAPAGSDYEFQRLHGMGEPLYDELLASGSGAACRVYAPVGGHEDLLAYLVRRLLENGSNTSFVNRIVDAERPIAKIVTDPVARAAAHPTKRHARIPRPPDLYGAERRNARGYDLADPPTLRELATALGAASGPWKAAPRIDGRTVATGHERVVTFPADRRQTVGVVEDSLPAQVEAAMQTAARAAPGWSSTPVDARADCLLRAADLLEAQTAEFAALCILEAGKTVADALADVREAVDFCRYYALSARADLAAPLAMPGPTGESNRLTRHGRGVFACISPWNFPLAIFAGQVAAALVAGNAVVAKPAEQTCLIADRATRLLHEAGVPTAVLQTLPGDGSIGAALVADDRIAGVAFTGSFATAKAIERRLAARDGPIVPFIAETGGQNAMIVDSSALTEQVVADVITSAFRSAGQRCSALRVLFLQKEVAPRIEASLAGAMAELAIGDPRLLATDVGPVIDEAAAAALNRHNARMQQEARLIYRSPLPPDCAHGSFVAPAAFAIDRLGQLEGEVFGPVLHVIEYAQGHLDAVLDAIERTGCGLTLGIHSRIEGFVQQVRQRLGVGNVYVNRSMIGAVVGVQPFGGEGLSGTGPKAGGPWYLHRFVTERVTTVNTAAAGGNAELLALDDDGID
jgi:delta-1-pyrroline-5-carboxylate dehydrogenase (PutA C-terminal domain)